jgi:iron(III) transport system substrate-binding protein
MLKPCSMPRRRRLRRAALGAAAAAVVLAACGGDDGGTAETGAPGATADTTTAPSTPSGGVVTVYTGRHYGIEPVFDEFTAATGIEVRFTTGGDPELRERLIAEGDNTPADVYMTADAGNIQLAADAGVLASLDSEVLADAIPAELRDEEGRWFGLSERVRTIVSSSERVTDPPTTYADVGDPQWKGRLCLRPSTHPYTQSLVASIIHAEGEARAEEIVSSWVSNDPIYINSDTDILKAIEAGDCDVAIVNHYYVARILNEDPDFPVAITWAEQGDGQRGAHVNVSSVGVVAAAPNPDGARTLVEWLATDGLASFSAANFEYPVNPEVEPAELLTSFGSFRADLDAVRVLGELQPAAVQLLDRVGYE